MNQRVLGAIGLVVAVLVGCDSSGSGGLSYEEDAYPPGWGDTLGDIPGSACLSQNVWAEPDFDWTMKGGVEIEVTVVQLDGTPWADVVVSVYDDASDLPGNQSLLAKGMTDATGKWIGSAVLPSNQSAVNIVVNIMGAKNWDRVPVVDGRVAVEFGRGE